VRRRARPEPDAADADERRVRTVALAELARRDYGRTELRERLSGKGFPAELVEIVLDRLVAERLLSDSRYVEEAVRRHAARGHGPVRIRAELRQRGVDGGLIDTALDEAGLDWAAAAREARRRKFGAAAPSSPRERAKQARFLQYRGFSHEQIRAALGPGAGPGGDFD
jgi:regulatory protein